jgi:hypothetical protein
MRKQQAPARSLVAIIEDMMISESKRYVELRFLRESLPFDRRAHIDDAMIRIRTTMEPAGAFSRLRALPIVRWDLTSRCCPFTRRDRDARLSLTEEARAPG